MGRLEAGFSAVAAKENFKGKEPFLDDCIREARKNKSSQCPSCKNTECTLEYPREQRESVLWTSAKVWC